MVAIDKRLQSLDAFRGMTIAGMILVNTPGSWSYVYPPLLHAKWHGCTPTDLVFPFFLFIVGVSMSFSYAKFDYKWDSSSGKKLIRRALLIFLIGLLLNAFPFYNMSFDSLRIMGVLQRIAIAYGMGAAIVLLSGGRIRLIAIITGIVLLGYWLALYLYGGDLAYSLEGNLVRQIDLALLGEQHLYKGFGIPFDPEGLFSSDPATGTVLIGFIFGRFLKEKKKTARQVLILLASGVILTFAGYLWGFVFPVNKPLWTSSYVLLTAGLAMIVLSIFYLLIDFKGWKKWSQFFVVFGLNPLFVFVLSVIWVKILIYIIRFEVGDGSVKNGYSWLYESVFMPLLGEYNGSLVFALTHVVLFWFVAWMLHKYRIFIKI